MLHMCKKINLNVYVTPEVFQAVERKRGLIPRSTYVEHLLVDVLSNMGEIEKSGTNEHV